MAKINNAKKIKMGTIKYFVDCGSEPGIWEGLIEATNWLDIII